MNLKPLYIGLAALMGTTVFAQTMTLDTDKQKVSYSIGVDLGRNIKKQNLDLDVAAISKGLQDGYAGGTTLLTDEQMKEVLMNFQKDFVAKRNAEMAQLAQQNLDKGKAF